MFSTAIVFALWVGYRTDDRQRAADRRDTARVELDQAADCIEAWRDQEATRDMGERVYRRNAETLIAVAAAEDPNRPEVLAYRRMVERDVAEIRAELPDPECDLSAARERVERGL